MAAVITLDNVTLRYGKRVALSDVSGNFMQGSLTAIAGPNGSGKSTLLKAIAGILRPNKGRITREGVAKHGMAYLPQSSSIQHDFPMPVAQAVATGFWPGLGLFGTIGDKQKSRVSAALKEVGLEGFENRQIGSLSGGQFQRMLFARIIVQDARVILLDEPFTAVDAETTARLMQLILQWHREGRTIVCVLHDLMLIQKYFPDSFVLAGKCLGRGHTHKMFEQKLLSFDLDMAEICAGTEEAHKAHEHVHGPGCSHDHESDEDDHTRPLPEHRH